MADFCRASCVWSWIVFRFFFAVLFIFFLTIPLLITAKLLIPKSFPIPKSFNKRQKQQALNNEIFPTKKPDIDNVAKAVFDALNGVIYKDDSLIVSTHISKLYEDAENNSKILVEICEI